MSEQLESLEAILYDLTGELPFGVLLTDGNVNDPKTLYVNEYFCAITGYTAQEFKGKNPKMLQGEKTDRAVIDQLRYSLENEVFFLGHTYNYTKAGQPFFLKWCISHFDFRGERYFFAIQKYFVAERLEGFALNYSEMASLFERWNLTIKSQMINMMAFQSMAMEQDADMMAQVAEELQVRMEFLASIANLINYIIDENK